MGKKLDALLGRTFKTSKFKPVVNLAFSRLAVLKNQRQVRSNQARSDVVQLLQQGHHDRALLRVEQVMKEQNMLDVFVMIEGYCNLLLERVHLVEQERVCPDELKEAISTLVFASTRCGEFPELQEIRAQISSRYGKEFVACAVELRNNCGVNTKMIQKLSTRQPELENRKKVLSEIAAENGIVLKLEEASSSSTQENVGANKKQNEAKLEKMNNLAIPSDEMRNDGHSDSVKRKKYRDVADAAQAAFESAAYAAAAARAAVELSRSNPPDDQNSPKDHGRKVSDKDELEPELENKDSLYDDRAELKGKNVVEMNRSDSTSSSDSDDGDLKVNAMSLEAEVLNESNNDYVNTESSMLKSAGLTTEKSNKQIPSVIQAGIEADMRSGYSTGHPAEVSGIQSSKVLNIKRKPFSVRTRQVRGY